MNCPFPHEPCHAHCRTLHLDNLHLQQQLADLEALLLSQEKELVPFQKELLVYRSLTTCGSSPPLCTPSPNPDNVEIILDHPTTFI